MKLHEAMTRLEAAGSAQTRKTYGRHGVSGPCFGVSYSELGKLKKQIKTDHALARELWATGNHDARVLALMVADPRQADDELLNGWARDLDNYGLSDAVAQLAAQAPGAIERAERWMGADHEWVEAAGWASLGALALREAALPDSVFEPYVERIERELHSAKNRVRHEMNSVLIAIGSRSERLEQLATAAAARIGVVRVDHGQTSCKTPDAASYIRKARAHQAAKVAKAAATG